MDGGEFSGRRELQTAAFSPQLLILTYTEMRNFFVTTFSCVADSVKENGTESGSHFGL